MKIKLFILLILFYQYTFCQNFWQQISIPHSGLSSYVITSGDSVFLVNGEGPTHGLYRSTNNGTSWGLVSSLFGPEIVTSLVLNSSGHIFIGNPGTLARSTDHGATWTYYASTQVRSLIINSSNNIFAGTTNIYLSTDNGDTWNLVRSGGSQINNFAINSSGHIFASTSGQHIVRTTNNGTSWTTLNTGLTDSYVYKVIVNPNGHLFACTDNNGIFRSTDNGDTWTAINTGLTGEDIQNITLLEHNSAGHIFAACGSLGRVFRSMDNGDNWSTINAGLPDDQILSLAVNSNNYAFVSTPTHNVYRSANSTVAPTITSPNGGENWVGRTVHNITWNANNNQNVKLEYSTNNGTNWLTIISSTPASTGSYSWTISNTPTTNARVRVGVPSDTAIHDMSDGVFTITAAPEALWITVTDVTSFTGATVMIPVNMVKNTASGINNYLIQGKLRYDPEKLKFRSVSTPEGSLFNDHGWILSSWEATPGVTEFIATGTEDITTNGILFNLYLKIIATTAGSATISGVSTDWQFNFVDSVVSGTISYAPPLTPSSMNGDPTQDFDINFDDVLAIVYHMYTSTDLSGQAFANADVDNDGDIDINDLLSLILYIAFGNWDHDDFLPLPSASISFDDIEYSQEGVVEIPLQIINPEGVLAGEVEFTYNPEEITFQSFRSEENTFTYATQAEEGKSIFVFTKDGKSGNTSAGKMLMQFKDGHVKENAVISTQYRLNNGEVKNGPTITFGVTGVKIETQQPETFVVSPNYPNPFNPSTTIEYSIPAATHVLVKIYDMLGSEVKTLVNEMKNSGTYNVNWNGDNQAGEKLVSGTYICRITAGTNTGSVKMLLIK